MVTAQTRSRGLLDTPILIDYRDGQPDAFQLLLDLRKSGCPDISQLSALVLYARCADANERRGVQTFIAISTLHTVNTVVMRRAQRLLETVTIPIALTANDVILAATAIEHSLPLYTRNAAQFASIPGLKTITPY